MSATTMTSTDARNRRALALLTDLLIIATVRPGAWEAEHVEALMEPLAEIFDTLTGANEEGTA